MYQFSLVRQQENNFFANFGRVSACAVCKCVVLCVGSSLFLFPSLYIANCPLCRFFLHLAVTVTYMKRLAFRSTFLSNYKCL